MITSYNGGFKARMVQRMTGDGAMSATALSREVGVSQASLSRWLREARRLGAMSKQRDDRSGGARRPKDWTPEEKLRIVIAAAAMPDAELGEFLRKSGLHEAQLKEWRETIADALSAEKKRAPAPKASGEAKRISELERELIRKDRALAEVTALLALKKKLDLLMGVPDEDTPSKKET